MGDREDELELGVILAEGRGQVLVHIAVQASQGPDDGHSRCLILAHPRRERALVSRISPSTSKLYCQHMKNKGKVNQNMVCFCSFVRCACGLSSV